jgi:HSP20 family protein
MFFKKNKNQKEEKKKTEEIKNKAGWLKSEGKLTLDVFENENYLFVQSAIAGINVDDLDISIENDVLEIKGERAKPNDEKDKINYFVQECYWGPFSREVVLQKEVDNSRVEASIKNGILTIKMPKIERERKRKIKAENQIENYFFNLPKNPVNGIFWCPRQDLNLQFLLETTF